MCIDQEIATLGLIKASGFGEFSTSYADRFSPAVNQWFQQNFPDLGPSVPKAAERKLEIGVFNPFAVDQVILHPRMIKVDR